MKRRISTFLLMLCLVLQLCPVTAAAANTITITAALANPVYPDVPTPKAVTIQADQYYNQRFSPADYALTFHEAVDRLRDGMVARVPQVHLLYRSPTALADDTSSEILYQTYRHTGVPNEGEALMYCWKDCLIYTIDHTVQNGYHYYHLRYDFQYATSAAEEAALTAKINRVLNSFSFTAATTEYEKVRAIYDYITANITYDYCTPDHPNYLQRGTPYAAMVKGTAICNGYALLFYRMCLEVGLSCLYVNGDTVSGYHAWNIVRVDGMYYHVDSTWDAGQSTYCHFLKGSDYFPGHLPIAPYDSAEFAAAYPTARLDYLPIPDHAHQFVQNAPVPPTCETEGTSACVFCVTCRLIRENLVVLPPLGHDYEEIVITPVSCTKDGTCRLVCRRDSLHTDTRTIPALGHDYVDGFCSVCGMKKPVNPFTDVKADDYFYEPVLWAVDAGVTTGMTPTTFAPNWDCSRAEVVTFLWRAKGCPEPASLDNHFVDVNSSDFFFKAVLWAVENGITTGTGETTFSPTAPCTRAQVATFLWRTMGKPAAEGANPFADVANHQYYYNAVLWAVDAGVTTGTSRTTFSPDAPCSRAQIATFLYRAIA